jgi:hypothetical protein
MKYAMTGLAGITALGLVAFAPQPASARIAVWAPGVGVYVGPGYHYRHYGYYGYPYGYYGRPYYRHYGYYGRPYYRHRYSYYGPRWRRRYWF